ncbi:hypothetical protein Vadar_031114 [Vaccinium darrowii]|uniref:Uncharacterized protein n=1 Tax=Vaccinium darrowii TaxID=229202 RepID=A0ACB7YZU3_9ERIC|nr:hypothetical protein Vadar_031114 [Vaccinium darrowii]
MKASQIAVLVAAAVVVLVLGYEAEVSMAAAAAVKCDPTELQPCLQPITSGTTPSTECCNKMRAQQPCFCQYIKNPTLKKYVSSPNAKKVVSTSAIHHSSPEGQTYQVTISLSHSLQMHFTTTFFIILVSVAISTCYSQDDDKYTTCARNFSCGQHFQEVSYPFWLDDHPQYCGHPSFELKCQNNEYPTIEINNRTFHVREITQFNHIITIASLDLWDTYCPQELHNFTFDNLLSSGPMNENLFMFYNCTSQMPTVFPNSLPCETGGTESRVFYAVEPLYNALENSQKATIPCSQSLKVPVLGATVEEISVGSLSLQEGCTEYSR